MRILSAAASLSLLLFVSAAPVKKPAYEIIISEDCDPSMKAYAEKIKPVCEEWYPKLIKMLPSDKFKPAEKVVISFIDKEDAPPAYAAGNRIVGSVKWFKDHPDDVGAFVHELTHVVQSYRGNQPGWLTEGIADYTRWFVYEPVSARPKINDKSRHTDSYRTTAHFLNWCQNKYDKKLVVKLNATCRAGKYDEAVWEKLTKKTLDELDEQWRKETLAGKQ